MPPCMTGTQKALNPDAVNIKDFSIVKQTLFVADGHLRQLIEMIDDLAARFSGQISVLDLADVQLCVLKQPWTVCFHCAHMVCVYGINGARSFAAGFWQLLVILSMMNLIDRFLIDGYWVGHTNAWTIPGTEDLKPYITAKDKHEKWLFGTVGMAVIAAVLARIMMFLMES